MIEDHASLSRKEFYHRAPERCRGAGPGLAEFPIVLGLTIQAAVSGNADEALALARRLAELAAEVLRRRALCEHDLGDTAQALATLEAALDAARRQEARMLELRAAMDLPRLPAEWGEPEHGTGLLTDCVAGFTEGFDTRDLREAKALLATLKT